MASILIADDDPSILRALSFVMRGQGYDVRTATDGSEALAAMEEAVPDLLLLDVMMPRSNGYDVCRTLRSTPRYNDVRIVMLSARGQDSDRRQGQMLGADAYITKPFGVAEVIACVSDMLARPSPGTLS